MRAPAASLTPLEVAVRRGRAALAGSQDVGVHPEAHRAAGTTPFETRTLEHTVEPLLLGLPLHLRRPRHHHRADGLADAPSVHDRSGCPQVLDPRVRAGADEDTIDPDVAQGC